MTTVSQNPELLNHLVQLLVASRIISVKSIAFEYAGKFEQGATRSTSLHTSQSKYHSEKHSAGHYAITCPHSGCKLVRFSPAGNQNAPGREPGRALIHRAGNELLDTPLMPGHP